jgi:excisionase family DNA binding protein
MFQQLYTITQTSKILRVSIVTLRRWDNNGYFKAIRIGKRKDRRYRKEDIDQFINNNAEMEETN